VGAKRAKVDRVPAALSHKVEVGITPTRRKHGAMSVVVAA